MTVDELMRELGLISAQLNELSAKVDKERRWRRRVLGLVGVLLFAIVVTVGVGIRGEFTRRAEIRHNCQAINSSNRAIVVAFQDAVESLTDPGSELRGRAEDVIDDLRMKFPQRRC